MLNFYKTIDGKVSQIHAVEDGCWVCAICPTEPEVRYLVDVLGLEQDFVRAALDEEESSRVESEEEQTLVIVDVPTAERQDEEKTVVYSTMPMAIITNNRFITTVCLRENAVISELSQGLVKNIQTHLRTQFLLNILLRIATRFLQYLKQIDKISYTTENLLHKTMRNKELIQILGLEKSLVYFSTSLKSTEVTLEKILRGRIIKLYDAFGGRHHRGQTGDRNVLDLLQRPFQHHGCLCLHHQQQYEYRDEDADCADHGHGAAKHRLRSLRYQRQRPSSSILLVRCQHRHRIDVGMYPDFLEKGYV